MRREGSTDDLVRRAMVVASWVPTASAPATIIELAYEVYRLRAERDRWKERWQATVADADAARAALERVRALIEFADFAAPIDEAPYWTSHVRDAIEGES